MTIKRLLSGLLATTLMLCACAGCSSKPTESKTSTASSSADEVSKRETTKITFLNSKGEIQSQLEEAAKTFLQDTGNIEVEIVPCQAGKSPFEMMSTMNNAGNAPTLSMIDAGDIVRLKENFMELDGEKWVSDAIDGTLNSATIDGKLYAFPFAVEGYGLIYNKKVLDEAFDGNFDPKTITSREDLKDAFDRVEKKGKKAVIVSPMDWSLGSHMFSIAYIASGKGNLSEYDKMFADLKAGTYDLTNNEVFNGWVDTFDLLKQYNCAKNDPLSITYEKGPELLGKGEVGFWFMGNWAWPQIKEFDTAEGQYGFVSFPISDTDNYASGKIVSFASKFVTIDKSQSTVEQQDAAKQFLNWLVYEQNGQNALIEKMSLVPAFKNIELPVTDPLGDSIQQAMAEKKTLNAIDVYTVMPADHWAKVGASLQKYLSNNADRSTLALEIMEYWKTVK